MITGKEGEKFKAGKLGEYTVGKDGDRSCSATRSPFNAANIDQFNF